MLNSIFPFHGLYLVVLKNDFYRTQGHDEEIIRRLLEQIPVPTEAIDFSRYS